MTYKTYDWRLEDNPEYTFNNYLQLLKDQRRNQFYKKIIQSAKPKTVLDFGCGIPIISKLCLDAGVQKVYAIDKNPSLVPYLEELKINFPDRFEYFVTDDQNLPDIQVECILSEMYGSNLYHENLYHIFKNCKKMLLPNGYYLPENFRLSVAPTNTANINKNTQKTLGMDDEYDWLNAWDNGGKTQSHPKYWLPIDTSVLNFATSKWYSFSTDSDVDSFLLTLVPSEDMDVELLYICFEIGSDEQSLTLNKIEHTDNWGNQFIRLPKRLVQSNQPVQVEITVLPDKKHISAKWL